MFIISTGKITGKVTPRLVNVNGEIGLMTMIDDAAESVMTFQIDDGGITALHRVMNPEKLLSLENIDP